MLEHLRAELTRNAADFVEGSADSRLCLFKVFAVLWCGVGNRVQLQQDPGQHLPDLVVQIASDPNSFGFLGGQYAAPALLALTLEPVEHLVEGMDYAADLVIARNSQPLAGAQQVDHVHSFRQSLQRLECSPQEESVGGQGDSQGNTIRRACASLIGALIVTGEAINRIAIRASKPALTAKTRQKREKARAGMARR